MPTRLEAPKSSILEEDLKTLSLKEYNWCEDRFGQKEVLLMIDAPWMFLDRYELNHCSKCLELSVKTKIEHILEEVAQHAEKNPSWLKLVN